jgi:hypothetical protein
MRAIKQILFDVGYWISGFFKTAPLPGARYTFPEETWLSHGMWKTGVVEHLQTSDVQYPVERVERDPQKERLVVRDYPPSPPAAIYLG